jgi:glutathione S-transferase
MKLFYSPGVCSLAVHIVLREAGYVFELEKVDLHTKMTSQGEDFMKISAKGTVPFLQLDDGSGLSEGSVINQFLADTCPESHLVPAAGSIERVRLNEWMNFIATELHKSFHALFHDTGDQAKSLYRDLIREKLAYVVSELGDKPYLMGSRFTIADAYLYTVVTWLRPTGIDLSGLALLKAYAQRIETRPSVRDARLAERLPVAAAA